MLKINTEENKINIEHSGDPITVAAELAPATGAIYNAFKNVHGIVAAIFQAAIREAFKEDSPAWEPVEGCVCINQKKSDAPTDQS